jgi:hypothetical protein
MWCVAELDKEYIQKTTESSGCLRRDQKGRGTFARQHGRQTTVGKCWPVRLFERQGILKRRLTLIAPSQTAKYPRITLVITLKRPIQGLPSRAAVYVSQAKLEKVVYPPRNPTTRNNRQLGCAAVFCVSNVMIAPIRKQSVTFAITAPRGIGQGYRFIMAVPSQIPAREPIAPPSKTMRCFSMVQGFSVQYSCPRGTQSGSQNGKGDAPVRTGLPGPPPPCVRGRPTRIERTIGFNFGYPHETGCKY